jgi:hypothetical protein
LKGLFMKLLTLLAALASLPAMAQSNGYSCASGRNTPEQGFSVEVTRDGSRADVSKQSLAGPLRIAALNCRPVINNGPKGNDLMTAFLSCTDSKPDAGYSLVLSEGGFVGRVIGVLSRGTAVGAMPLANLNCKSN